MASPKGASVEFQALTHRPSTWSRDAGLSGPVYLWRYIAGVLPGKGGGERLVPVPSPLLADVTGKGAEN